jgi:hypothetical protein
MYPTDKVCGFLEERFGTYNRALMVVNGTQIVLIFAVAAILILVKLNIL